MKYLYKISSIVATLALIAGLSFSTSYAQATSDTTNSTITQNKTYTISGKVVNAQKQAVADAKVTILSGSALGQTKSNSSKSDKTNKKGQFKVANVSSGTYTVKVEADGYKTSNQQVTITKKDKTLTITLQPAQK